MSLNSLIESADRNEIKFVFVGGKGGVGKTTSSSAIACLLASRANKRVLLVSTDPAHSLGDAWKMKFTNSPKSPMKNLDVMEVDPKETMDGELQSWIEYSRDLLGEDESSDDMMKKINSFQDWLTGIPGIDEATALSSAIRHIESGEYDIIVFDTAPTGHTLKLLALPEILEQGIEKLQSWQTTMYGYWEAFKGLTVEGSTSKAKKRANAKKEISKKLENYKQQIQKVALMLQDKVRTRFVVVCIAEYLSISETQRLLQELVKHEVKASHVIVNQLVVNDALSSEELNELELKIADGGLDLGHTLLQKTIHACRLTTARKGIQQKYLGVLKECDETKGLEGICEVPLLAEEVTGNNAITRFSQLLVTENVSCDDSSNCKSATLSAPSSLYDTELAHKNNNESADGVSNKSPQSFTTGDTVQILGLEKAPHYNELSGKITKGLDTKTLRYGVELTYNGNKKILSLQAKNLSLVSGSSNKKPKVGNKIGANGKTSGGESAFESTISKAKKVLEDPEIKEMIAQNPRAKDAVEDVMQNPMNFVKYLSDPELSPFLQKVMSKL